MNGASPAPSADNFQIYLRLKPRVNGPSDQQETIRKISDTRVQITSPYYVDGENKNFDYSHVFNGEVDNEELFTRTMVAPIGNVLNGFNSSVLIYGMTGAGKTHTMFGQGEKRANGIIFLTLQRLFELASTDKQFVTKVRLCFYEIYNESIRDLLRANSNNLSIVEDQQKGVTISDISEYTVEGPEAARTLILEGVQRRAMNSTKTNDVSSRSHAIIQLTVSRYSPGTDDKLNMLESKFFLVDLAGNEKTVSNYTNLNKRFVEGININKSLLTLGKCINILSEQKKGQYVPFRDSKLTRLLKESLGGNAKTVMIACVSPEKKYYEETLNTLKYSSLAGNIKNKSKRNLKEIKESELRALDPHQHSVESKPKNSGLMDTVSEFAIALEDKVRIDILLENLLAAKAQNNRGSTSEDELDLLIGEMESEKNKQILIVEKQSKGLVDLLKIPDGKPTEKDRKLAEYEKIIRQQRELIESLKHQLQQRREPEHHRLHLRTNETSEQPSFQIASVNTTIMNDGHTNSKSLVRKALQTSLNNPNNRSTATRAITNASKNSSFNQWPRLNESEDRQNLDPLSSMKTSTKLVIQPKKPKELSIDLTSEKKPSKDEFILRLKWVDKNTQAKSQHEFDELLALHNTNHYDLEPSELQLLRRLRERQESATNPKKPVYVLRMNSSQKMLVSSAKSEFRRSSSRNNLSRAFK